MTNQQLCPEKFSVNLKRLRIEKGYSREKFAELMDVSSRMIYDWENGISLPHVNKVIRICLIMGETMDGMFT